MTVQVSEYIRYRNGEREIVQAHDRSNPCAFTEGKRTHITFTGAEGMSKAEAARARLRAKGYTA